VSAILKALIIGLIAATMASGSATAQSASPVLKIQFGPPSGIPNGYYELCVAYPDLCRMRPGQRLPATDDGSVALSLDVMNQLESVNAIVNAAIRPSHRDAWTPGEPVGDCKDFAMTKRQRLIDAGWPTSALLTAIVWTSWGERHLVLVARTTKGDFVLDNLNAKIVSWRSASYTWEKIQSPTDGLNWRDLRRPGSAPAAAVGGANPASATDAYERRSGGLASSTKAASAASRLIVVCSAEPRRRIETARSAASRLPIASSTGTLASECSRTL
jgi:predicted transglutaminase-like cysteine proteinase